MKFNLKTPCTDCPFIQGSCTNLSLAEGRIQGIVDDLRNGMSFTCHKTLSKPQNDQQHCAGAMIFLEKENRPNQVMRIAERLNLYQHDELSINAKLITNSDY